MISTLQKSASGSLRDPMTTLQNLIVDYQWHYIGLPQHLCKFWDHQNDFITSLYRQPNFERALHDFAKAINTRSTAKRSNDTDETVQKRKKALSKFLYDCLQFDVNHDMIPNKDLTTRYYYRNTLNRCKKYFELEE